MLLNKEKYGEIILGQQSHLIIINGQPFGIICLFSMTSFEISVNQFSTMNYAKLLL